MKFTEIKKKFLDYFREKENGAMSSQTYNEMSCVRRVLFMERQNNGDSRLRDGVSQ